MTNLRVPFSQYSLQVSSIYKFTPTRSLTIFDLLVENLYLAFLIPHPMNLYLKKNRLRTAIIRNINFHAYFLMLISPDAAKISPVIATEELT